MYCVYARKKASAAQYTQHFLGACPQIPFPQSILRGPTFCICPGPPPLFVPPPILSAALSSVTDVPLTCWDVEKGDGITTGSKLPVFFFSV